MKNILICNALNTIWKSCKENDVILICFCKDINGNGICHGDVIKNIIEDKL